MKKFWFFFVKFEVFTLIFSNTCHNTIDLVMVFDIKETRLSPRRKLAVYDDWIWDGC